MSSNGTFNREEDYPGLYKAADAKAIESQKIYFRTLFGYLALLILGAISSLFAGAWRPCALASAALFLGSLALTFLMAMRRYDRTWYSARAVAESVKTRAWRYMMRVEPYQGAVDPEVRKAFLSDLKVILKQNREVTQELHDESAVQDPISEKMGSVRELRWSDRLRFYREHRVEEQLHWYQKKAKKNRRNGRKWFCFIVILNAAAVGCALLHITYYSELANWPYLPTEIFAVAAGSAVSWLQAKRFNDLSTSYALTTSEINFIYAALPDVTEEELSPFVSDTENAFSREHTQWAARRGVSF